MWQIYNFWETVANFINGLTLERFVSIFWFFVFIELPRYLIIDLGVLVVNYFYPKYSKAQYKSARSRLYLEKPLISIISPGKNEGKNIYTLIRSLDYQTYTNFELIVVDDGSDDNTKEYCKSFVDNGKITLFLRNEIRGGKASAANFAVNHAKGKYIIHLDADSSLDPTAVEEVILPFYLDKKIGAVGGNIFVRNQTNKLVTSFQSCEYLQTIMLSRIVTSRLGLYRIVSGAFGAFRADVLAQVGRWDIGPGLDGDLTQKVRNSGLKVHFTERAICRTNVPETWWALTRQRLRWSKSLIRFRLIKHFGVFKLNKNFNFANMLASLDNLFYNMLMAFLWVIYMTQLILFNHVALVLALGLKIVMYTIVEVIKLSFVSYLLNHNKYLMRGLWFITPLMSLYMGVYMRIIRLIAYIQEAFGVSYKDPWNPAKTSIQAQKHGL